MSYDPNTRTRTIARNSFWTSLDTAFGIVPQLLISVIVASKVSPAELGYFNFVIWIIIIAGRLGLYGMGSTTRKYVAEFLGRGDANGANAIISKNLRHQFRVALGVCSVAVLVVFALVPPVHRPFSLFAVASLFPMLLMVVYAQALTAAENFRANVVSSMASTTVNVVAVSVLLNLGLGLTAVASALFLSRMSDLLFKFIQFRRHFPKATGPGHSSTDQLLQQRMTHFYWLSSVMLVLDIVVWDRSELIILKAFSSLEQLAFYSLAFNISTQIFAIPLMISTSAGASLMVQYGRDARKTGILAATTTRYMCLLAFPALLGLAAVSHPLISVLYRSRYIAAAPVLMWLSVLAIPKTMMLPAQQQVMAFERQSFLVKWGVAMAVLNVGVDVLLIRRFGALGGAWGNGISQTVSSFGILFYAIKYLGVTLNFPNLGRILAAAAAMAAPVAIVAWLLPSIPALFTAIPLGILLYPVALRFTGALLEEDYQRLSIFLTKVPLRWRGHASRLLRTLTIQPSLPVN